jgi:hypothetical protein
MQNHDRTGHRVVSFLPPRVEPHGDIPKDPEKIGMRMSNSAPSEGEKGPGSAKAPSFVGIFLVPEVGIEPTRTQGPEDFESSASTNFTTPAQLLS